MLKQSLNLWWSTSLILVGAILLFSCNAFGQNVTAVDTGATQCSDSIIGKISFKPKSAYLNKAAYHLLDSIATNIRTHPACRVMVSAYLNEASYFAQQLSWDRAFLITKYLIEKGGVSESRIIFSYESKGNDTADISFSNSEHKGIIPPPPAPNFSTLKHQRQ